MTYLRIGVLDCLNCGQPLTGLGMVGEDAPPPGEGDVLVCLYCSHLMEWRQGLLAELDDQAIRDIAGDPDIIQAVNFADAFQKERKDKPK